MTNETKKTRNRRRAEPTIVVQPPQAIEYPGFSFEILHDDPASNARVGRLTTPHGAIETPNYIFCGTKGAIKGLAPDRMVDARADIILSNTYHLMIQPGADTVEKLGGLHHMMQWNGPMMTDSGGFQIFSMGHGGVADEIKGRNRTTSNKGLLKITEEGAAFRSYLDGTRMTLTPETSMQYQRQLGADLIYQFDECTAYHVDRAYTEKSMERSHRWGDRCLKEFADHNDGRQGLYGITQGGVYEDLRDVSCAWVNERPFFGQAVGGSLGGSREEMFDVVGINMDRLRKDRPTHLLGIGRIVDVFNFVPLGIDTFDCVEPTRIARHGMAFQRGNPREAINLKNAQYRHDDEPLDPSLDIPASRDFSKGYIHHLLKANELLGAQLVAQHNVATITRLMREIRAALRTGTLAALREEWLPR